MKKLNFRAFALLLAALMTLSVFMTACTVDESEEESSSAEESTSESANESENGESSEEETEESLPVEGPYASSIVAADKLQGTINAYFESSKRDKLIVENSNVVIDMGLSLDNDGVITVKNKDGGIFLNSTSNAYIKTLDGKYYYASNSTCGSQSNIYRMGYYMYDVHVYGNDFFAEEGAENNTKKLSTGLFTALKLAEKVESAKNVFAYKVTDASDPRAYMQNLNVNTAKTRYIRFSLKTSVSAAGEVYVLTDSMGNSYSGDMVVPFKINNDGEFHEYVLNLSSVPNYKGTVTGLRFDVGSQVGETVEIKDISVFDVEGNIPSVRFDRGLYVYSDKVNQVMHLIAPSDSEHIAEYGFEFKIPVDSVAAFVTEDRQGKHDSPTGVHWGSATYVGFDIKDVGVFGFIKINDYNCGNMKVTVEDGYYVIRNYDYAPSGTISKGSEIYMGNRLYFGDTHSFDELQFEAWCEYNPLDGDDITVITEGSSPMGRFYTYDGLRGAYKFDVRAGNWNNIFLNAQNMHYNVKTNIKGDGVDRKIYIYTSAVANGQTLECAVLMDQDQVIIPIPLEVCKNFAGDGEANEFLKDEGYSEVYFPLVIGGDEEFTFTVSHLYQNWGKFPLKQIDSIQFYTPFYHLSCGVTETNCLRPYYEMNALKNTDNIYCLPDHRAMSAPLWIDSKGSRDPQHTNGGFHHMLEYIDTEGRYITTEFVDDCITSYGPTYAEIVMDYITDDGKIKVSYTHMEMPQTDENRGFYICTYEFLDDLTITDSRKTFSLYSVAGRYVDYGKLGYLDSNNQSQIVDNTLNGEAYYELGDLCPYFDLFKWMPSSEDPNTKNDYVNVSCLVYSFEAQMGGESFEDGLMVYVKNGRANLTLDADELNFKKGDKITLNMIVIPWGSQLSDYNREDADWNVREVRNNTLLDPMTVTATNGQVIESVFLPRVMSTDGKSAEFTLSGGENNVTVEIQGMKSIARPQIFELVNGEWEEYVISSKNTPDSRGNAHEYDGYMIRYDGDGSFSYSFVVDMNGDVERTFKIIVE